jgi:GT2 family glycosyltransferase
MQIKTSRTSDVRVEIVSATRLSEEDFLNNSALGISLRRLSQDRRLIAHIAFENQHALPEIYNARIASPDGGDILVFVHDDVWIDDYFMADRVIMGLEKFDVIGVVGNRRRVKNQPAWAFIDNDFTWDEIRNLSGCVAHGNHPFGPLSLFGAVPAECELLDGVFLAVKKSRIKAANVLFDPCFDFHFYDMDFCRNARMKGLRLGTWPICITHQSGGAFGSEPWIEKYRLYLEKWNS